MNSLIPHPEGGSYCEIYRGAELVQCNAGLRNTATVIYFRLRAGERSRFHRLRHDELWFWHEGATVTVHTINEAGHHAELVCGPPNMGGEYCVLIRAGVWFGALPNGNDVLVSAVVAPGFEFADFDLAEQADLMALYPQHAHLICLLT